MKVSHIRFALCLTCLLTSTAFAQIRSSWFDVNPNQSNRDPINPNGASGGRVTSLTAINDLSICFAASEWGGLWQSFNQGLTWSRVRTYLPTAMFDVKFAAPTPLANRGVLYATSAHDGRITGSRSGIALSRDQGASWNTVPLSTLPCAFPNENAGWNISVRPSNPDNVFIATECGLARTLDAGNTWTYLDPTPLNGVEPIFAVAAFGTQLVAVIGQNGYAYSKDNGANWRNGGAGTINGGFGDLAVSPYEPNVLYAAINGNLFETRDTGATWPTSITVPFGGGRSQFVSTNRRGSNQYDLWYGDFGLARATCTAQVPAVVGGAQRAPTNSWTADMSTANGAHNDLGEILFNPTTGTNACPVLVGSDGGVYRNTTTNGNCQTPTWEQPNITPHATWLYGFEGMLGANGQNQIYYGLQDNGTWGTTAAPVGSGATWPIWDNIACCDGFSIAAVPGEVSDVQGASVTGRTFRLRKSGEGYAGRTEVPNYPTTQGLLSFAAGRSVISFGRNTLAATFGDGVYNTTNRNANPIPWTFMANPSATSTAGGGLKNARNGNNNIFFYHTGNGRPYSSGQIATYTGTAGGGTWTTLNRPTGTTAFTVYDVDPNNSQRMMAAAIGTSAAGGGNVFTTWRTTNGGANWTAMPILDALMTGNGAFRNFSNQGPREFYRNLGQVWQPYMFEINPNNANVAVAGAADAGIFLTTDFGNAWVRLTNPLVPTSALSTAPHIPRPLFAWFSTSRVANSTTAFDVWIGTQGGGVHKFLIESP